ncbi:hypothetical protein quinque_003691 [Culex quinquefasciatus]
MTGDGTTTAVLLIRELYIGDGLIRGLKVNLLGEEEDECLTAVVELLTKVCVIALRMEVDLQMIEMMEMQHKSMPDTQLVRRVVMDYRSCHPDKPM